MKLEKLGLRGKSCLTVKTNTFKRVGFYFEGQWHLIPFCIALLTFSLSLDEQLLDVCSQISNLQQSATCTAKCILQSLYKEEYLFYVMRVTKQSVNLQ